MTARSRSPSIESVKSWSTVTPLNEEIEINLAEDSIGFEAMHRQGSIRHGYWFKDGFGETNGPHRR